jgi:RND family efflux transporter MFP subunit
MTVCLALLLSHLVYDQWARSRAGAASAAAEPAQEAKLRVEPPPAAPARATTVTVKESKLAAAQIAIAPARTDRLPTAVSVVGTIQVNADRQVEVRPRSPGVVREVHALLGQRVRRGDPLVTLDSPEIGIARLDLRARQSELTTARFEAAWKSEIAANVALLIPELRKGIIQRRSALADDEEHAESTPPEPFRRPDDTLKRATDARVIEKQFAGKPLGVYRGMLLQAYAEFDIASHEEQKTASLRRQDIVGEHPALVARHQREGIQAKLESAIEDVQFKAAHEKRLADQTVRIAEAAVVNAAQRLRILGVPENIQDLLDHAEKAAALAREEDVTFYRINAPFDGTIIQKTNYAVPSARADTTEVLFVVADLRSVWVKANVSESDVDKIPKVQGGTIRFSATAYPRREFTAKLLSVGAVVDPQTRKLPILAQTDNPDDLLKVGMFVSIVLDSSTSEAALTVPASAVVEIDNERCVFIPTGKSADGRTFSVRPIEVGRQSGDRLVVTAGLKPGEEVVSTGAFLLKSELILKNQQDEE